jgi:hypothetical protein
MKELLIIINIAKLFKLRALNRLFLLKISSIKILKAIFFKIKLVKGIKVVIFLLFIYKLLIFFFYIYFYINNYKYIKIQP